MRPAIGGSSTRPSAIAPPAPADCLNPPLNTATTPGGPSTGQSIDGPASGGTCIHPGGSPRPTCQRRSVVLARSRATRKAAVPTDTVVTSTRTPRPDVDATAQPFWAASRAMVVVVVDVVVVVVTPRPTQAAEAARALATTVRTTTSAARRGPGADTLASGRPCARPTRWPPGGAR